MFIVAFSLFLNENQSAGSTLNLSANHSQQILTECNKHMSIRAGQEIKYFILVWKYNAILVWIFKKNQIPKYKNFDTNSNIGLKRYYWSDD